jgi:hypothetical protein
MSLARLKRIAINAFIALIVSFMVIDSLPQSPQAVQLAIQTIVRRIGIHQGPWNMFAPTPDRLNLRLRAEIRYRDGERAEWSSPEWRQQPLSERWLKHRHQEFGEMIIMQEGMPALEPWTRHLARSLRPDFPDADRGAEVRITYQEAEVPDAAVQPWTTWREPPQSGDTWTLTIEKFP